MSEETTAYIDNVSKVIDLYKEYVSVIEGNNITPSVINEALANYEMILLTFIGEYSRKTHELFIVEEEFQSWWDERFVAVRRELNDSSLAASKWLSKSELQAETRVRYAKEYKEKNTKLFLKKEEVNLYRRLIDSWKKYDSMITNLSLNMRSELKSLSLQNRMNGLTESEKAKVRVPVKRF